MWLAVHGIACAAHVRHCEAAMVAIVCSRLHAHTLSCSIIEAHIIPACIKLGKSTDTELD